MSVSVYRAAIHATLGTWEDLEHVIHLRPKGGITPDTTSVGCVALAERIAVAWASFWNSTEVYGTFGAMATKALFVDSLAYDKITVSYLTYPGENATPVTVTPGQQWNWPTPIAGTNDTAVALPNEVALALTLLTDQAGPRTRGRIYLGGLSSDLMSVEHDAVTNGLFKPGYVNAIGHRFGVEMVDGLHVDELAQAELNIVSRVGGSSRGVGGVRVGQVPDSQRRRRWNQPENAALVWGTA